MLKKTTCTAGRRKIRMEKEKEGERSGGFSVNV
jgi:hypothetical protein